MEQQFPNPSGTRQKPSFLTSVDGAESSAWVRTMAEHAFALDRVVYEPIQLFLLCVLSTCDENIAFLDLLRCTRLTPGNLGYRLIKLEQAGFCAVHKEFVGKRPRTTFTITTAGRDALHAYAVHIKALLGGSGLTLEAL